MSHYICRCRYEVRSHFCWCIVEPQISHFANFKLWRIGTNYSQRAKNWYLYVTYSVPISHFAKNTHVDKFHIAYIRTTLIDKIVPPSCYILHSIPILQFCHLLTSVTIKNQFHIRLICDVLVPIFHMCEDWVQVLHTCGFWYQFFTSDDLLPIHHRCEVLVPILHTSENLVSTLHIWEKIVPAFAR